MATIKAYYRFLTGGLTADYTGNGYTLTNVNGVAETASGKFGYGADYGSTNTDKYLYISNNLGIAGNGDISISGWFYINNLPTSGNTHMLLEHYSTTTSDRYFQIYLVNSGGTQYVTINCSNTYSSYTTTLTTNAWHHIVGTRNVSGNVGTLYIDNSAVTTCEVGTSTGSTNLSRIGGAGLNLCLQGVADDIRYYDGVLSSEDVSALFSGGESTTTSTTTSSSTSSSTSSTTSTSSSTTSTSSSTTSTSSSTTSTSSSTTSSTSTSTSTTSTTTSTTVPYLKFFVEDMELPIQQESEVLQFNVELVK